MDAANAPGDAAQEGKFASWSRARLIARIQQLEAQTTSKTQPKRGRDFDFDKYQEQKIALKIAYFGWNYHGLAVQDHVDETIEGHLFHALTTAKLVRDRTSCDFTRCGRTDKGVSAFAQVVSLDIRTNRLRTPATEGAAPSSSSSSSVTPPAKKVKASQGDNDDGPAKELPYVSILNRLLPPDIRVLGWAKVDRAFNSRFSCLSRVYKYYFWAGRKDMQKMEQAAQMFLGVHDFRNFCKMDRNNETPNFVRHVYSVDLVPIVGSTPAAADARGDALYACVVVGKAFLWHQIRCMMAVLFAVGDGLEQPEIVRTLLDITAVPAKPVYDMAPEAPLVLFDCVFEDVRFFAEPDDHEKLVQHLRTLWQERQLKATMTSQLLTAVEQMYVPATSLPPGTAASDAKFVRWADIANSRTSTTSAKAYVPLLQRPTAGP